jgi:hypothetical protein
MSLHLNSLASTHRAICLVNGSDVPPVTETFVCYESFITASANQMLAESSSSSGHQISRLSGQNVKAKTPFLRESVPSAEMAFHHT